MYYVYLLRSKLNKRLYIGCTSDLKKRLLLHNSKKVLSTKRYVPYELMYYEAYLDKFIAYRRELTLKTIYTEKRHLKERLNLV